MSSSSSAVGGGGDGAKPRASGPSATTVMLLAVSFYLIAMTLPVTVVYAVYFSFPEGGAAADIATDATWRNHLTYWTIRAVVQEIGMSHYAGNIIIYADDVRAFSEQSVIDRINRLVLAFWYRLTQAVPDKGPLNGCVCVCVCAPNKQCHIIIYVATGKIFRSELRRLFTAWRHQSSSAKTGSPVYCRHSALVADTNRRRITSRI